MKHLLIAVLVSLFFVACDSSGDDASSEGSEGATEGAEASTETSTETGSEATEGGEETPESIQCLYDACEKASVDTCMDDQVCLDILTCIATCTDQDCAKACWPENSDDAILASTLFECGMAGECLLVTTGGSKFLNCMNDSCGEPVAICEETESCATILGCMNACEAPECVQACFAEVEELGDKISAVTNCLVSEGCVSGDPTGLASPVTCVEAACPDQWTACSADEACASMLECWTACAVPGCGYGCIEAAGGTEAPLIGDLLQCGQGADCLTGGGG